ncbi:MAG: superoxide dismutase [Actinomycetota bacterium]|jgi:Fe-Mn family superoxide dismutase|nr:superoxide dismutase [Actinomycetota bacterium]
MATYTLPDLPYDYSALEPHISGKIMELHHSKHHQTYVTGANTALEKLAAARESGDFGTVLGVQQNLSFNLSGHVNHSVFWQNMSPAGGDKPTGELASAIERDFGSFDAFRGHFKAAATAIQGSGWGALTFDGISGQLLIGAFQDHQSRQFTGATPLLLLDMWEHAFYLQYQNVKADYVDAWWNVVNWADVSTRYAAASQAAAGAGVQA